MQSDGDKKYRIKKIFGPTIQGEGAMAGTVCHFVRFSACNMWDGRSETKEKSECPFCDTDFRDGEYLTAQAIVNRLKYLGDQILWVTLSGGEPMLQYDEQLSQALREAGFKIAIETNGTTKLTGHVDHLTVSPKVPMGDLQLRSADTLKLLFPHPTLKPEDFMRFECAQRFLQPIVDVKDEQRNIKETVKEVLRWKGIWKLSMQIHKMIGVE